MTQYTIRENTPLKFHWFFAHITLPLTILAGFGKLVTIFNAAKGDFYGYYIDIAYFLLLLVLCAICLEEFSKKNSNAFPFIIGIFSLNIAYSLLSVGIYAYYLPDQMSEVLAQLFVQSVFACLVGIYYWKRRFLFSRKIDSRATCEIPITTGGSNETDASTQVQFAHFPSPSATSPRGSVTRYCKNCGGELTAQKKCRKCGKQYFYLSRKNIGLFAMLFALLASIGINAYQYVLVKNADNRISSLITEADTQEKILTNIRYDYNELFKNYDSAKGKATFMDNHVVIVYDDGTGLYHKWGCSNVGLESLIGTFWAYNTEAAKSLGYSPCWTCN